MNTKRILVVDDEPSVTRSLKLNLEARAGYEVRTENDSALAIDAARDFHPHLILLDVLIPRPDGCEVAARIRTDPELKDTPIVFLTALANNEHTGGHAMVAGSTVYLAKPVDTEELIKCIEQTLSPTLQTTTPRFLSLPMKTTISPKTATTHDRSTSRPGQPAPHHEHAAQPSPGTSRPGKRILLVDDDPTVRDSLNDVLVAESYFVIPAENGLQALDLANKSSVDLVLLDLNMPVKNGWDTFEQLTREHPLIPIIIATALPNQLFTAVNAGVGALLEKPMDIPILLRTMEKLLLETAEQRLARLAGKKTEFHYKPATASHEYSRPAKYRWRLSNEEQTSGHEC